MLTLDQIRAAQANDLEGISAVLEAMDSRITRLASRTAGRLATNPARYSDYVEDFRQDAAVSLFEHMPRWEGDSVDAFFAFMYASIEADLRAKLHAERNPGIDRDAISVFKDMVARADGDLALAERLAQTVPPAGRRLSADRAQAARVSWAGTVPLESREDDDAGALLNFLRAPEVAPDEVRPKVGHGAAATALSVLERYAGVTVQRTTPRSFAANLPTLVGALEDTVVIPREATARRAVLDAMAILRSAVSTATDGDLTEDLRGVADERSDERAAKHGTVHAVLDSMSGRLAAQADALRFTYGIDGFPTYGGDMVGMGRAMRVSAEQAKFARTRGHKSFAARYIKAVATSEAHAATLTASAAINLGNRGRK